MATCPKCLGALTDDHRCPSRIFKQVVETMATVLGGGALGVILCFAIEERPTAPLLLASAALGGVVVNAFRQATSRRV